MSTIDEIPSTAEAALLHLSTGPAASTPSASAGLWQTAILAIGRRVAAAVGATDHLAADAAAALAESLDFDFCGMAEPSAGGGMSLSLTAVKTGVTVPTGPLSVPERPEDSLIALATSSGRIVATVDMGQESRYRDVILRRCQAQSALACPLRSNGANYGSMLLASLAPRTLSAAELVCVETIGHLVAAALARSRAEQLLDQSQMSTDMLEAVDAPVIVLDRERRLLQINRNCEELTGFSFAEVQHRNFCGAFVATGEESAVNRVFDQLLSDGQPRTFDARLLLKHGDERRVEWRFRRLAGNHTGVLVGTGMDVTAKCELEGRVAKLQRELAALGPQDKSDPATANGEAKGSGNSVNRRKFPRRPYPYAQRMGPVRNGQMPRLDEFYEVECRDISAGGFSYYSHTKPIETDIVIAFGAIGTETFLIARIVYARQTIRNGKTMFTIGCEYTGRGYYNK